MEGDGGDSSSDSDIQILDETKNESRESGEYDSFFFDTSQKQEAEVTTPGEPESNLEEPNSIDRSSLNFSSILSHFAETPKSNGEAKNKGRRSGQMCFNCNSTEHPARDCPHPRDHRRISQNRNSFNSRRESGNSVRLHENQNSGNGKEGMMLPGKISQELRQALGIGDQDLPEWIYRMRAIGPAAGYPPAYRKKAAEMNVFKMHLGESTALKRKHGDALTVDPDKIIKYPGFNYDDGHFRDQKHENFKIPPFTKFVEAQQLYLAQLDALENMCRQADGNDGNNGRRSESPPKAKKRKISDQNAQRAHTTDSTEHDESNVLFVDAEIEDGEIRESCIRVGADDTSNVTVRKSRRLNTTHLEEEKTIAGNTGATIEHYEMQSICSTSVLTSQQKPAELVKGRKEAQERVKEEELVPIDATWIPRATHITDRQNYEVTKPSLENFARDIQPFMHQKVLEKPTGFIQRLHKIVKDVKAGFKGNEGEDNN